MSEDDQKRDATDATDAPTEPEEGSTAKADASEGDAPTEPEEGSTAKAVASEDDEVDDAKADDRGDAKEGSDAPDPSDAEATAGGRGEGAAKPAAAKASASDPSASERSARLSAGARLAAQKAAKAAVKAAKKEERKAAQAPASAEASSEPESEDPVDRLKATEIGRGALKVGGWWEHNQQLGWGIIAAVAIVIVGVIGWRVRAESSSSEIGTLLNDAMETASARIVASSEANGEASSDDEAAPRERTFPTTQARDEAAITAFQAVIERASDLPAANVARLGLGRALLDLGRHDEARDAFQAAFDHSGRSGLVAWQALEGVGFANEAAGRPEDARAAYERLADIENHAYQQIADYHLARLLIEAGQRDEARTALRAVVDALRADTVEGGEPRFPFVLSQAELRLRELDPSSAVSSGAAGAGGGGGGLGGAGSGLEGLSPEQLQQLIRQFQQQQGGSGEGGSE